MKIFQQKRDKKTSDSSVKGQQNKKELRSKNSDQGNVDQSVVEQSAPSKSGDKQGNPALKGTTASREKSHKYISANNHVSQSSQPQLSPFYARRSSHASPNVSKRFVFIKYDKESDSHAPH